jgi:sugar O-acyltransferase (sialic acid O-acetyltransferase NeuD family)
MKTVGVYGASGCGRGVMPLMRAAWLAGAWGEPDGVSLVFIDDALARADASDGLPQVNGHACLSYAQFLALPASSKAVSLCVSKPSVRRQLAERCAADGVGFVEARAANVVQMDEVALGEGAVLSPFVTLTSNIRIGRHFHANLYSYIEHDCLIGDFVTFAPGVHCNGNVHIGDGAYLGAGALIRQGSPGRPLRIGAGAVVGMGAVVLNDVPPGATVVGNPARLLKA